MNETPDLPRHDPYAALRQRNFQLYSGGRIFGTLGQQMFQAVMAWQVYQLTDSPLSLGILGLARFVPALLISMVGGTFADTYDRRKIIVTAQVVPVSCSIILATATAGGWVRPEVVYGLVMLLGLASAFEAPARTALLPGIVRPETFANAVTVNNIFQKLGSVSGPTIAGFLIGGVGISTAYAAVSVLVVVGVSPILMLKLNVPPAQGRKFSLAAMKEGLAFVLERQVILGSMSLDLMAMVFGGAQALLPVYATDVLDVGPTGFGLLASSLQVGAFAMSFVLVFLPPIQRTGRALVWTVAAFGLLTMVFGLSRELWLSLLVYSLIGAADQISVVMRQTTIQMATPDELRGRVSSVHQVFVQSANQINAMESAFVATLTSAAFAIVSGGAIATAIAGFIGWRMPVLYRYQLAQGSAASLEARRSRIAVQEPVALAAPGATPSDPRDYTERAGS